MVMQKIKRKNNTDKQEVGTTIVSQHYLKIFQADLQRLLLGKAYRCPTGKKLQGNSNIHEVSMHKRWLRGREQLSVK